MFYRFVAAKVVSSSLGDVKMDVNWAPPGATVDPVLCNSFTRCPEFARWRMMREAKMLWSDVCNLSGEDKNHCIGCSWFITG